MRHRGLRFIVGLILMFGICTILSSVGITFLTWQYWAILLLTAVYGIVMFLDS